MDLDNIRVFTKVARFGSLTKAAENLKLPKSTVSRRLSELETQLGARLIQRTTRRLSLTAAGQRYFQQTERLISELEAAEQSLQDLHAAPNGTLRITTPTDVANSALLPVFASFLRMYPDVRLVILATNRRVDLVAEGVDLALRAGPLSSSSLIARKLSIGQFQLFASPAYLTDHPPPSHPEELSQHQCLAFDADQPVQKWSLTDGETQQEVMVAGRCAISDYGGLCRACVMGLGIALLPAIASRDDLATGRLARVLPQWRGPDSLLHAVYPSANHLSPAVRAFVDHVAAHFTAEG